MGPLWAAGPWVVPVAPQAAASGVRALPRRSVPAVRMVLRLVAIGVLAKILSPLICVRVICAISGRHAPAVALSLGPSPCHGHTIHRPAEECQPSRAEGASGMSGWRALILSLTLALSLWERESRREGRRDLPRRGR